MSHAQPQLPTLSTADHQLLSYLRGKASYYQSLLHKASEEDQDLIREILESIQLSSKQLSEQLLNEPVRISFRKRVLDVENYCLRDIFKFYAVQHLFLGRSPTFQMISNQTEILDCGSFLAFCKQFCIFYDEKRQKLLKRDELTQIFKKHATLNSFLTFTQFLGVFESISKVFFCEDNDLFGMKVFLMSEEERKILFLEYLRVADVRMNRTRMRPLSTRTSGKPIHRRIITDQNSSLNIKSSEIKITKKPRLNASNNESSYREFQKVGKNKSLSFSIRKRADSKAVSTQRHFSTNKERVRTGFKIFISQGGN